MPVSFIQRMYACMPGLPTSDNSGLSSTVYQMCKICWDYLLFCPEQTQHSRTVYIGVCSTVVSSANNRMICSCCSDISITTKIIQKLFVHLEGYLFTLRDFLLHFSLLLRESSQLYQEREQIKKASNLSWGPEIIKRNIQREWV